VTRSHVHPSPDCCQVLKSGVNLCFRGRNTPSLHSSHGCFNAKSFFFVGAGAKYIRLI